MQELISALTAHEEECSREFEADLSAFCTRHMDAQLVQQLRQLVTEGEEDLAYRAFYALTIIYRNRKDYQQLQALFEENPHFAGHPSYHHLLILFQLEAETFFDALELLELAREDARQHRDNAGYLHLFAHLFVYTCEKSRGEMREQVRREYYDDVEQAVEDAIRLDPAYAKFYCTKARVVAQRGRYAEAYSLINKAVATESSARKDYALRLLDYRHCETVILLQEQREYFQGEMEKLRKSVPSLPKPKTFVPGRGPKAYEGAEPYCFVSYAHINSDRVYPIVEQLMQRGIRLWYDDGIEAGSDFREFIAEKIRDSWQVLLFAIKRNFCRLARFDEHCLPKHKTGKRCRIKHPKRVEWIAFYTRTFSRSHHKALVKSRIMSHDDRTLTFRILLSTTYHLEQSRDRI